MKSKITTGIMLTLLFIGMLTLAFNIQPVKAYPKTIYVDDDNTAGPWDGTQEDPYQNITSALKHASVNDTIYVYNGTYYENPVVNKTVSLMGENKYNTIIDGMYLYRAAVTLNASNVNISGFTIRKGGFIPEPVPMPNGGILILESSSGNNITNNIMTNNTCGIFLSNSSNNILADNTVLYSNGTSIWLLFSNNNIISENNIKANNYDGIALFCSSNNNIISGNQITANNGSGILVVESSNNSISGNNITNNGSGIFLQESSNNSISGNSITANNEGGIYLGYSSNSNTISGNSITANNYSGIWLDESSNNSIYGNRITANEWSGIKLYPSSYNTIYRNNITNNGDGITLEKFIPGDDPSNYNSIYGNSITANHWHGVDILSSSYNTVYGNNLTSNGMGIRLGGGSSSNSIYGNSMTNNWYGVDILSSSYNTIYGNSITANDEYGIYSRSSNYNSIYENNITDNGCGIELSSSSNNNIYHNNFVNHPNQVLTDNSVNVWDDGYPSGGNCWSDYNGTDLYSGPYQNETGSDAIGDTPYVIDANNTDNYPLVQPYGGPVRNLNTGHSYPTIQEGINNASEGDTIFVLSGTYYERVVVNKSVSLIGENRGTTIIDGNEMTTPIVHITANNVTIRGFTIQNSMRMFGWEGGGIYITNSNRNNIVDNSITNTQYGINLRNSTNNTIIGNNVMENDVGIQFLDDYSSNSTIYHNNFINNGWQVSDFAAPNNTWDDGYPSGGNYWSDNNPPDIYSGPYQNEAGRDGIGDTPYIIDGNNTDKYPLIHPYAYVPSPDVNDDGIIDIFDIVICASAYGSRPGDPNWNPIVDLNQDGIIDIFDVVIIGIHYGETYP